MVNLEYVDGKIKLARGWFILISSFFIISLYNIPTFISRFLLNISGDVSFFRSLLLISSEYLLGILILSLFLSIFIFSRILLRLWVYIFIILSALFSYYAFTYTLFIDELLIGTIFETDIKEAFAMFSIGLVFWVVCFALIPIMFFVKRVEFVNYGRDRLRAQFGKFLKDLIVPIFCWFLMYGFMISLNPSLSSSKHIVKNTLAQYFPFNFTAGFYQYFVVLRHSYSVELEDISKKYNFKEESDSIASKEMTIVLVIGESARADHQSLNGYNRDTNPELSKVKNLTSFPNVTACGTLSRVSINCILSRYSREEFKFPLVESNIISVFNYLGFESAFLAAQSMYETDANYYYLAAKDADKIVYANNLREHIPSSSEIYDEYLFPYLDEIKHSGNKRRFIVVYLSGSHVRYKSRYPKKFEKWTPSEGEDLDEIVNAYDNTVLYTDYVLSEIINKFKDENAFLYYVSDHGESLGEDGRRLHGAAYDSAPKEQLNVAQFFWASDSMIKLLGNKYNNIVYKKNKNLSQDNVFSTLLDCIGISSEVVKKDLSLCSSSK